MATAWENGNYISVPDPYVPGLMMVFSVIIF
jgi:hypothetical protein